MADIVLRAMEFGRAADRPGGRVRGEGRRGPALVRTAIEQSLRRLGGDPGVWPIVGASTVERIDEVLDARDLKLDAALRTRLDEAA
jgi:aryl-alcohol dehydrogenase-like predicted oxidoreductase